jgi:hypothetical protein
MRELHDQIVELKLAKDGLEKVRFLTLFGGFLTLFDTFWWIFLHFLVPF